MCASGNVMRQKQLTSYRTNMAYVHQIESGPGRQKANLVSIKICSTEAASVETNTSYSSASRRIPPLNLE